MESLPSEPDPPFFTVDILEAEEDTAALDQLPVNVTTINAPANPSGKQRPYAVPSTNCGALQVSPCCEGDPFAVTAVLSRQLSVTRKEWLKYTANQEDPAAPLYTQGTLAKALQTPGNEHLVANTSFLTTYLVPEPTGIFSFAAKFKPR